jgi:hypothetical protein
MSDEAREIADWLNTDIGFGGLNDARLEDAAVTDETEDGEGEAQAAAEPAPEVQAPLAEADPVPQEEHQAAPVSGDPEVILTADGKHALPFSVLRQARAEKAELEQRLAQMQAQMQAQQAQAPSDPEPGQAGGSDDGEMSAADWQQVLSEALADGDREMARAARAALADRERLNRIEARLAAQDRAVEEQRGQAIAAAVQAHPDLALWATDEALLARAQAVERSMLTMPGSALAQASDWPSYFEALARATAATYPDMPRGPRAPAPAATPARRTAVQAAAEPMPRSISDIPGGIEPGAAIRTAEDLQRMPKADQLAHLTQLRESGRIFDFLDGLPMGAFNTGRE